ncbi:rRNA maturation RNase YbeY [Roseobacter ponti]|uniref:Endoribonuclease YbeY n=1 Tax=Roseobacter ponti TaxID=1891787 RepID=A0A858SZ46_9RHOB|nr:rRNA maturation RNase YbeY [Roseobacter ponti]QJF52136.1 rRNA maturation RNase YbeY [Roseobacter ponti]
MAPDILIEDPRWQDCEFERLATRALATTLAHLGLADAVAEISLLACNDARIAGLNTDFRDKAGPTNVLSWPAAELAAAEPGRTPQPPVPGIDGTLELGDIAIAFETCRREATDQGIPMDGHVTHLIVHGLLHLLGYDHIRDADATLMQRLETEILGKMGLDDPYRT